MNYQIIIAASADAATSPFSWLLTVGYIAFLGLALYFLFVRPQKKQQRQQDQLMGSLAVGDSVCTTAGFYGVVIDMVDDNVVIVEFGNNKNCRIPVKKTAIVEVEKPEGSKAE